MQNSSRRASQSSRRLSNQEEEDAKQLVDEIESLSQSLYQAQSRNNTFSSGQRDKYMVRKQERNDAPLRNPMGRRFSSYESSKTVSSALLPGFSSSLDQYNAPDLVQGHGHYHSRHSLSSGGFNLDSQASKTSDIRIRGDRRVVSQSMHLGSPDLHAPNFEEFNWADDNLEPNSNIESTTGEKKKSFWNWKPLRALSHIGRQRFHCMFSAYVRAIRNLPPAMNGLRLCVNIRKEETKEGALQTVPSRVFQGVAEYEETMFIKCSVYGSKGNSNTMKFMSKVFIVSVVAPDVEELELGKHSLDLSRLLPHNKMNDMEKGNSWNASLELSGKAKGGKLIITFTCEMLEKDSINPNDLASKIHGSQRRSSMQGSYSLPNSAHGSPHLRGMNPNSSDSPLVGVQGSVYGHGRIAIQDLNLDESSVAEPGREGGDHQQLNPWQTPASPPISVSQASFQDKLHGHDHIQRGEQHVTQMEDEDSESDQDFTVVDKGVEINETAQVYEKEERGGEEEDGKADSSEADEKRGMSSDVVDDKALEDVVNSSVEKKEIVTYQMVMKTLDSLLQGTSEKELAHREMLEGIPEMIGISGQNTSKDVLLRGNPETLGDNLDQEIDLVTGEFLHMLESEDNYLEETFEGVVKDNKSLIMDQGSLHREESNVKSKESRASVSQSTQAAESTHRKINAIKERTLTDPEPEAVLKKEKLLSKSATKQFEPEPLGKGLGTTITIKDGGTLRSMSPLHFQSEKCNGKLVMQVSKQIVLPAEIGSGTVDVLRNMASIGIENMALQTMKAMPLEELMGLSMEQIAMEGLDAGKISRIRGTWGSSFKLKPIKTEPARNAEMLGSLMSDNKDVCVSLDNIAHTAMHQIEYLAMIGLKIQVGMTDEDAPYSLHAFSMQAQGSNREDMPRQNNSGSLMKGVTGVHLLKGAQVPARTAGGGKGLMDMAITLDEWVFLDSGVDNESGSDKDKLAIMAAHRAIQDGQRNTMDSTQKKSIQWGCMGNTLTIAMLIQIRDPLRSLEAIGAPMIAFVQAERVIEPKVGVTQQPESQFKVTGVHLAGLRAPEDNRRLGWGSQRQFRAATRWLLANGVSKPRGNVAITGKNKAKQGDHLWSISAQLHGSMNKWKDLLKLNPHLRNPNVLY